MRLKIVLATLLVAVTATGCAAITWRKTAAAAAQTLPRPAHIVVVVMENKSSAHILDTRSTPFLASLARTGALLTNSYAIGHPSLPNYLALFSGSTQGVRRDECTRNFSAPNLASSLLAAHASFVGYVQGLPKPGTARCHRGQYTKVVTPWQYFRGVPAVTSQPLSAFPTNYNRLPDVSFVTPNLMNDMHNGSIARGDEWLSSQLASYAQWATTHNSLLIVTWDEDDHSANNHIPTIITGAGIKPGRYGQHITHYDVLRTLTELERIPPLGLSATVKPIESIWAQSMRS